MFLSWVEPGDEFVNEEPVEYAYEDQAFDNSENLAGKMTTLEITSIFALLVVRSIAMLRYLSFAISCLHIAMSAPNHPFPANRCVAMLPLLLSPFL